MGKSSNQEWQESFALLFGQWHMVVMEVELAVPRKAKGGMAKDRKAAKKARPHKKAGNRSSNGKNRQQG